MHGSRAAYLEHVRLLYDEMTDEEYESAYGQRDRDFWDHLVAQSKRGPKPRTHCRLAGHAYTAANTRLTAKGGQVCRACDRERSAARRVAAL